MLIHYPEETLVKFEFIYDFGSPNAYLSHVLIPDIEDRTNSKCIYRPVLLGGVFKSTNNRSPMEAFAGIDNKIRYIQRETQRFIAKNRISAFTRNPHFPVNTLLIMRGAVFSEDKPYYQQYVDVMFKAMWERQKNMTDLEVVEDEFEQAGLPAQEIIAGTQDPEIKQRLIQYVDSAVSRGVFGAPSFFVGDELYFGKDSLPAVEEALTG